MAPDSGRYVHKAQLLLKLLSAPTPQGRTRARRGTLQEVTRATNGMVTGTYLSQLARGQIEVPAADKLEELARGFQFDPAWWFTDLGDMLPESPVLRELAARQGLAVQWWLPALAQLGEQPASVMAVMARLASLPPGQQEQAAVQVQEILQRIETGRQKG